MNLATDSVVLQLIDVIKLSGIPDRKIGQSTQEISQVGIKTPQEWNTCWR